jgi:hypothetical protein
MAICAWLAGDRSDEEAVRKVQQVREGFFFPSLGTATDYFRWMEEAGLRMTHNMDWTANVARTWELCLLRVRKTWIRSLARLVDQDTVLFLDHFQTILDAYNDGSMK